MRPTSVLRKKPPNAQPANPLGLIGPSPGAPTVPPWFADRFPRGTVITATTTVRPDGGPFLSRLIGASGRPGEGTVVTQIVAKSPKGKVLGSTKLIGPTMTRHGWKNNVDGVVAGRGSLWT